MSIHQEISFESEICQHLAENGWLHAEGDAAGYDRKRAIYPPDVLAWVQETQPKAWETLVKNHGSQAEETLMGRLRDQLDQRGSLDVLRHGIELLGLKDSLKLAEFKPALAINPDIMARYAANRLRVIRQVRYSLFSENSIDLVLFLNGIPVATVELKTDFTQSIGDAIDQYRSDRLTQTKTMELFGTRPDPTQPAGPGNLPAPFHVYSMRQAIEEKFILDVLQNYTSYKLAFRLAHEGKDYDEKTVERSAAMKGIMGWVRLHPYNISQKVQIVVEHFRAHVSPLLDGKAKAMVVVGSRVEAVRWQLAIEKYIAEHHYKIGTLVAFSGEVSDKISGPDGFTENSTALNPNLKGRDIREAFKTDEYQILLVANKFQTGFDQPLLCGMYVDKRLAGIQAVQTLSRLNRAHPGKDTTYVLDFVNDTEERAIFYKRLLPLLEFGREREGIDLSKVQLTRHKLINLGKRTLSLYEGETSLLAPLTEAGSGSVQEQAKVYMAEIIEKLNALFGAETTDQDQLVYVNHVIMGKLLESETLRQQAANNTKEQFANSPDLKTELMNAIMGALDAHASMSTQALNSPAMQRGIKDILLNHARLWETLRGQLAS